MKNRFKISSDDKEYATWLGNRLWEQADAILKRSNVCSFKDGVCEKGKKDGCCWDCGHLSPTGCTTRSLTCKFWMCSGEFPSSCNKEMRILRRVKDQAGFYFYGRETMKQQIEWTLQRIECNE